MILITAIFAASHIILARVAVLSPRCRHGDRPGRSARHFWLDRPLQRIVLMRSPFLPPSRAFGSDTYHGPALANWTRYAATSAFSTNGIRRRCCYKPTTRYNKSPDPVDLPEKLRLRRKLRPALQHLAN